MIVPIDFIMIQATDCFKLTMEERYFIYRFTLDHPISNKQAFIELEGNGIPLSNGSKSFLTYRTIETIFTKTHKKMKKAPNNIRGFPIN